MRDARRLFRGSETEHRELRRQLLAHACGCARVREEHRAERDVSCASGDQLERLSPVVTPPMPTIGRSVARYAA